MAKISGYILPLLLVFAAVTALIKGRPAFSLLSEGIRDGLHTVLRIFPPVAATLTAAYMFRASGALEALTELLTPVFIRLGIPPETAGLMLLRPLSGSGALGFASELMAEAGPDSEVGRIAAVMLGGTETTFYVISVYFGAAGVKKSRHAIPAALVAELCGFFMAGAAVRWMLG